MSVFNNSSMVQGRVSRVGSYDSGSYQTLFLKVSVFSYKSNEKAVYESINAQISCKVNEEGKTVPTSSHPKAEMNKRVFDYLNDNVMDGIPIKLYGTLKGNEQIYLNQKWRNFKDLSLEEKEDYQQIPKNQLITRNQTYLSIEEAQLQNKATSLDKKESQEPDAQMDGLTKSETNQADSVETDDNDPVDNHGVVQEPISEAEMVEVEKRTRTRSQGNIFDDLNHQYYDPHSTIDIDDMDLPF